MLNTLQRFGQVKRSLILSGFSRTALPYAENTPIDTENSIKVRKSCYRCAELRERYIPAGSLTIPPKCMGLEYRIGGSNWNDVVASYRNYYRHGKGYMNKGKGPQWNKVPSRKPKWF